MSLKLTSTRLSGLTIAVCMSVGAFANAIEAADNRLHNTERESAAGIVSKIIDAMGGYDALKRFNYGFVKESGSGTSAYSRKKPYKFTSMWHGKRRATIVEVGSTRTEFRHDGTHGWFSDGFVSYRESQTEAVASAANQNHGLSTALLKNTSAELLRSEYVRNRLCDVLRLELPDTSPIMLWADKETHLVLRTRYKVMNPTGLTDPVTCTWDYSDYRTVEGVAFPMCVESEDRRDVTESVVMATAPSPGDEQLLRSPDCKTIDVDIPFEIKRGGIVLSGSIDDEPAKFVLDTGVSSVYLNGFFAQRIKVQRIGEAERGAAFFSNMNYQCGAIDRMKIGGLEFRNVPVLVGETTAPFEACNLGVGFLRQYAATIDFDERKLKLRNRESVSIPPDAVVIPVMVYKDIYVEAIVGKSQKTVLLLDTGSTGIATLSTCPPQMKQVFARRVRDLNNASKKMKFVQLPSLALGSTTLHDPIVSIYPCRPRGKSPNGLLGLSALKQFRTVTFDWDNERLICEPWTKKAVSPTVGSQMGGTDARGALKTWEAPALTFPKSVPSQPTAIIPLWNPAEAASLVEFLPRVELLRREGRVLLQTLPPLGPLRIPNPNPDVVQ